MDIQESAVDTDGGRGHKGGTGVGVMTNLFISPSEAFATLRVRPRWFAPFLVCTLCMFVFLVGTNDYKLADMKREIRTDQSLSPEQTQRRIANIEAQQQTKLSDVPTSRYLFALSMVTVIQAVTLFGTAFAIWIALHVGSTKVRYSVILAVCSYSYLVKVPEMLLKTPLIITKGTMRVHLGLADMLPQTWETTSLYAASEKIGLFSVWLVVLLVVSLPIVADVSRRQAVITVASLWAIWLLASTFLGNMIQIV